MADARRALGLLYLKWKRPEKALEQYKIAGSVQEELVQKYPKNAIYLSNLSTSYDRIGDVHKSEKKFDEAVPQYEKAIAIIRDKLIPNDPDNIQWKAALSHEYKAIHNLAEAYGIVGDALKAEGEKGNNQDNLQQALEAYKKGFAVIETILSRDPKSGLDRDLEVMQEKIQDLKKSMPQ